MPKKSATAQQNLGPHSCAGKKKATVAIYNPWKNKMVRVNPYSADAKKLYKYYIKELGYDPAWIAPADLKFYADSYARRRRGHRQQQMPPVGGLPDRDASDRESYRGL